MSVNPDYPTVTQFITNNCPTTQTFQETYFAGIDPTYSTYNADLNPWAEEPVMIRFHLSGDVAFPGGSWWIDDVEVTRTGVPATCSTAPAGPPPVPDGASVPGVPLQATPMGNDILITWDAGRCPATAVNIYYGPIGEYTTFTGGFCNLPPTGSAVLPIPDNSWFLAVATDGVTTDGSWNRDTNGDELNYAGASLACPAITQHVTSNGCP